MTTINDPLRCQAKSIFNYFTKNNFEILISTVAIAEFCTKGDIKNLPMEILKVISFDFNHALKAADFAKKVFAARKEGVISMHRNIIPNDVKLFAQADCKSIDYFLSSDAKSKNIYDLLKPNFQFIDIGSEFDISELQKIFLQTNKTNFSKRNFSSN